MEFKQSGDFVGPNGAEVEFEAFPNHVDKFVSHTWKVVDAEGNLIVEEVVTDSNEWKHFFAHKYTTFTVTLTQFGNTQTVTFKQLTAASTTGFSVTYGAVELNATAASGSITIVAAPTHHYELVKSVSWLKIETSTGFTWDEDHGDVTTEGTVTIGSGIAPASGTVTLTVTAEDNITPKTADAPAPVRQTTVLVRDITTGEVVSVLVAQKGGQAAA